MPTALMQYVMLTTSRLPCPVLVSIILRQERRRTHVASQQFQFFSMPYFARVVHSQGGRLNFSAFCRGQDPRSEVKEAELVVAAAQGMFT